jgi:hypothetical protein
MAQCNEAEAPTYIKYMMLSSFCYILIQEDLAELGGSSTIGSSSSSSSGSATSTAAVTAAIDAATTAVAAKAPDAKAALTTLAEVLLQLQ